MCKLKELKPWMVTIVSLIQAEFYTGVGVSYEFGVYVVRGCYPDSRMGGVLYKTAHADVAQDVVSLINRKSQFVAPN